MGRRLIATVHVRDEAGVNHAFAPGVPVPDWAAEQITNPAVWADDEPAAEVAEPEPPAEPVPAPTPELAQPAPRRRSTARRK